MSTVRGYHEYSGTHDIAHGNQITKDDILYGTGHPYGTHDIPYGTEYTLYSVSSCTLRAQCEVLHCCHCTLKITVYTYFALSAKS